MNNKYGNVIWTNHALDRLRERGIAQGDAWAVWRSPDKSRYSQSKGGYVYSRDFGNQTIEVVAKQNEKKEWIILSVWAKPKLHKFAKVKKENWFVRLLNSFFNFKKKR